MANAEDLPGSNIPKKRFRGLNALHENWLRPIGITVAGGVLVLLAGNFILNEISQNGQDIARTSPEGFARLWSKVDNFNRAITFFLGGYLSIRTLRQTLSADNDENSLTTGFFIFAVAYWWLIGSMLSAVAQILLWSFFGWLPGDPAIADILSSKKS
ncbi:MAG: hypothetical protein VX640_04965 [Pseudomonadota bacterium]|nr:hypothetical protein [Pseudomonadota bacterium]